MKTESGTERPTLGQLLDVLINSDRVVIIDGESSKDPELYRGFVGCFNYDSNGIDTSRRIAKTGLGCEIFRVAGLKQIHSHKDAGRRSPGGEYQ